MKNLEQMYKEWAIEEGYEWSNPVSMFCSNIGYHGLIESIEHEIITYFDEKDYQGSSVFILEDGDKIGYLVFGWGSCSYCDALQACDTIYDLEKLRTNLFDSIIWFDSKKDLKHFIMNHDYEADYLGEEITKEITDYAKSL